MDWDDERFIKVYTRDTTNWLALSWQARGLFLLLLRKLNRAGAIDLGRMGTRGVAVHVDGSATSWPSLEPFFAELVDDGCVVVEGSLLRVPNFVEAQAAIQSPAARKRAERERERDEVTKRDEGSRNVTKSHEMSRGVTRGHAASRAVTTRLEETRSDETRPEEELSPTPSGRVTAAPRPKATKPTRPPPPFSAVEAVKALAATAGARFAVGNPDTWPGGWKIALAQHVRRFPDLAAWSLVGEWLAAGGGTASPKGAQWASTNGLIDAMAQAKLWDDGGRPGLLDGRGFPVRAKPAEVDPWEAEAKAKGFKLT
jgi:hypothetical protein